MIVARTKTEAGKEILILGLSAGNMARLLSGEPIAVTRETHGERIPEDWEIIILYGQTENGPGRPLKEPGAMGPETEIHEDVGL